MAADFAAFQNVLYTDSLGQLALVYNRYFVEYLASCQGHRESISYSLRESGRYVEHKP